MNSEYSEITLENLAQGAAGELFDHELRRVVKNIIDANTEAKDARKIILTVTIQPDEDRETAAVSVKCEAKLAGIRPKGTRMHIYDRGNGEVKAFQHNFRQQELFNDKVVDFKQEGEK